ncbi:MAG: ectoine synthase [Arenicellales bacterium]|jgi:L-ectoine synthase|nr:L-ectoine synthase [Rhodospirillaceae bacterium]MDP6268048.1 ectoine synthase [Arenicellales bacterium]MDP7193379.1 ectoine synthase [Arenicellales bacterium]MDP7489372.1 ectoine synthase [Arenicellales bacterium]MDP7569118.1 ectoine synthase [Arenicellales bacterium]|tara:strand:- start:5045 stop:5428 length:384 start_codon:yes stop_codon:yes gene_type:complete
MFVRRLSEVIGTERDVDWGSGQSRRLLIEKDNMGFAFLDTIVNADTDVLLQYRNHLESVYCIEGEGEIIDQVKDESHTIVPGTLYVLDKHDLHRLRAFTTLRLICVFCPPIEGTERHDMTSDSGSAY